MVFDVQGGVVDLVTFEALTRAKTVGEILLRIGNPKLDTDVRGRIYDGVVFR